MLRALTPTETDGARTGVRLRRTGVGLERSWIRAADGGDGVSMRRRRWPSRAVFAPVELPIACFVSAGFGGSDRGLEAHHVRPHTAVCH